MIGCGEGMRAFTMHPEQAQIRVCQALAEPTHSGSFFSYAGMMTEGPFQLLHVGCGPLSSADLPSPFNQAPWQEIRLDIDPGAQPDVVASITDMSVIGDGAVHALWSSHNLEHLYPHEVPTALSEFARVLRPDGFAVITVPDLERVAAAVARGKLTEPAYVSPAGPVAPIDMLFGFRPSLARGHLYMAHRTGFTAGSLEAALREAGFAIAEVCGDGLWALWAVASRRSEDADACRQLAERLAAAA